MKMVIYLDDLLWLFFGFLRVVINKENIEKFLKVVDSLYNGLILCIGLFGVNRENNILEFIRYFGKMGRIYFMYVRNIKFMGERFFYEILYLLIDGLFDMFEIMKVIYDIGFDGYL